MPTSPSLPRGCGYVVTDEGRSAARQQTSCDCTYRYWNGTLFCEECGTIGNLIFWNEPRPSWRDRKRD